MTSSKARRGTAMLALAASFTMVSLHTPAAQAGPSDESARVTAPGEHPTSDALLAEPTRGRAALAALGDDVPVAAARNASTTQELRELLLSDRTAWLSNRGKLFYKEPTPGDRVIGAAEVEPGAFPYAETFLLHSNPGSQRTIYLDFDGATVSGTWWNESYPGLGTTHPAWNLDGEAATFNTAERDAIQLIWQTVAEDFAPFDVDVTTQDPGNAALERTSAGDLHFGTRALVSPSMPAQNAICPGGCGGVAFLATYGQVGSAVAQPAWVFPHMLGNDAKFIAEAVAHEVGHNLGLDHDGRGTDAYHLGNGAWAPIMGAGYYRPLTQWSIGDYPESTNAEDDLALIHANGLSPVTDDHAATTGGATGLGKGTAVRVSGVVSSRSDVDLFAADVTCAGTVTVTAAPDPLAPNLDIRLRLLDATGTQIASADPVAAYVNAATASGLSARISRSVSPGSYYLEVDGVGAGSPAATGYSDYGSLGDYTLQVDGCLGGTVAPLPSQPTDLVPSVGVQQASVSWQAPANAAAAEVSGYRVRLFQGPTLTPLDTATVTAATLSKTFSGLSAGTPYEFDVVAVGAAGTGTVSPRTTRVSPLWPFAQAPSGMVPSAGVQQASVSWQAPANAAAAGVSGYQVRLFVGSAAGPVQTSLVPDGTLSATFTGLTTGNAYSFDVQAIGGAGGGVLSARSAQVTPTAPPLVRPGKVTIGQAQAGSIGGSITATARWTRWTSSDVTGYKVVALRLDAGGRVLSRTRSSMQAPSRSALSMVLPGKGSYAFVVQAFNQTSAGPVSARSNRVAGR